MFTPVRIKINVNSQLKNNREIIISKFFLEFKFIYLHTMCICVKVNKKSVLLRDINVPPRPTKCRNSGDDIAIYQHGFLDTYS